MARPGARVSRLLALLLALLVGLAAGLWAGQVTLRPSALPSTLASSALIATVAEQSVGRELDLNVTVSQPKRLIATNVLSGITTQVSRSGTFRNGDVLYAVSRVPVRAVEGTLPFYRPLKQGMEGPDVRQLRAALVAQKLLHDTGSTFDVATKRAVAAWQKKLGIAPTGSVTFGELVAIPRLPAALQVDESVAVVGTALSGGERIVYGSAGTPQFDLVLQPEQAQLVPNAARVTIAYRGHRWVGVAGEPQQEATGEVVLRLRGRDGATVCGRDCGLVATGKKLYLVGQVQVVAPAKGPGVPVAAVMTDADGHATVTVVDAAGVRTPRPVTVRGSQDGIAVVDGLTVGEKVQVFGDQAITAPSAAQPTPTR